MEKHIRSKEKQIVFAIAIIVTTILSYGFLISHVSMGVDDEAYNFYFTGDESAAQGRVGYVLIRAVANIYEFTPVWRESLGITIFVCVIIGCLYLFKKASGDDISGVSAIIFATISLSYPILADRFLFSEFVFSTPVQWLLCALGIFNLVKAQCAPHKKGFVLDFTLSVLCFCIAMMFEKAVMIMCVTIAFQVVIIMQLHEKSRGYNNSKTMFQLLGLLITSVVIAFLLSLLGTEIILKSLHVRYNSYVERYIQYDWSAPFLSLKNCLSRVKLILFSSAGNNEAIHTFLFVIVVHFLLGIFVSIKNKNLWLFLCVTGYSVLPFAPYVATANPWLPFRIMDYWALWTGFAAAAIYKYAAILLQKEGLRAVRTVLRYFAIVLCGICVIRQSYAMTRVFYLDYRKYQKDVSCMEQIVHDLQAVVGAELNKPVLFLGLIPDYDEAKENEVAGGTIFNWNKYWSAYNEITSRRIYDFFAEHGHPIEKPVQLASQGQEFQDFQDEARRRAASQTNWPQDGYIREYPEYVLVRLGQPLYQIYNMSSEEILKEFDRSSENIYGDVAFTTGENGLGCYGWFAFPGKNNWQLNISMLLLNTEEDKQYIIQLTKIERPDVTQYLNDGFNYDNTGFQRIGDLDGIGQGTYQVGFLLEDRDGSQIIMQDRIYTVP